MTQIPRITTISLLVVLLFIIVSIIATTLSFNSALLGLVFLSTFAIITLCFFKPFFGLLLYLIFIYTTPQEIWPQLAKLRIMLGLALIVFIIFLIHKSFRRDEIHIFSSKQQILMTIMLLIVPISNISNLRLHAALDGTKTYLTIFFIFFFIVNLTDNMKRFRYVCLTLIICTTYLALNGILQYHRGYNIIGISLAFDSRIRYLGWFGDPNDLALAFNTFTPLLIMFFLEEGASIIRKIFIFIVTAILLLAIYYTNSRGGMIGLLAMIAFAFIKKRGLIRSAIPIAICIILAVLYGPSRMDALDPYEASAAGRIHAWIAGLNMLKTHPIFGVGFDNFLIFHRRVAHNSFVQVFAELGLVGYFFWIAIIYTSIVGLFKVESVSTDKTLKGYSLAIQLSLIGFLVSALFLTMAHSPIFSIIIALATVIIKSPESGIVLPNFLTKKDTVRILSIVIISVLFHIIVAIVY